MRTRIRLMFTLFVALIVVALLHIAATLMNTPHDFTLYGGVVLVAVLFVLAPPAFARIWKGKKNNESHEDPTA